MLLSPSEEKRKNVAAEFWNLKRCCIPRGLKALHTKLSDERNLLSYEFKILAEELAWQTDLSIFDREVSHARVKADIESANGNAPGFEHLAHTSFGKDVWMHFAADLQRGGLD
eukprot:408813-Pyramimonas_sp.AAC.1